MQVIRPTYRTSCCIAVIIRRQPLLTKRMHIRRWVNDNFDGPELLPGEPQQRDAALRLLSRGAGAFSSAGLALLGGRTSG